MTVMRRIYSLLFGGGGEQRIGGNKDDCMLHKFLHQGLG
jgi:hypothetical protein